MLPESAAGRRPPLVLCGPTATGKSAVALLLAEKLGGEIISVDSMQVYRGMDIGTTKPSSAECARVPHHLIDLVNPGQAFDVAQFVELARQAMADIWQRGRLPVLCGGTGLYLKALMHGLGEAPPTDPCLRAELETVPLANLLAELAEKDPVTYACIDRRNPRRVIRAVEVIRLTRRPFSEQRAPWIAPGLEMGGGRAGRNNWPVWGLARTSDELRRRIDNRVEEMFQRGLVAETKELLGRGLNRNRTAQQALGYRQVIEHLRGERSLAETIALVKIRTHQFAKRQMTWFRRQLDVRWITVGAANSLEQLAEQIAGEYARL